MELKWILADAITNLEQTGVNFINSIRPDCMDNRSHCPCRHWYCLHSRRGRRAAEGQKNSALGSYRRGIDSRRNGNRQVRYRANRILSTTAQGYGKPPYPWIQPYAKDGLA